MNTVSSSSTFSTSAATSYGMSGLISGLDTEGMVEQMLSGTQNKIDQQNAQKQQIIWKQEIYRELISDINGFKNSFFSSAALRTAFSWLRLSTIGFSLKTGIPFSRAFIIYS